MVSSHGFVDVTQQPIELQHFFGSIAKGTSFLMPSCNDPTWLFVSNWRLLASHIPNRDTTDVELWCRKCCLGSRSCCWGKFYEGVAISEPSISTKKSCHLPKRSERTTGKMTIKLWANWCFEELGSNLFYCNYPFFTIGFPFTEWPICDDHGGSQFSESPVSSLYPSESQPCDSCSAETCWGYTSPGAFFVWTLSDENELGDLHKVQCHDHQVEQ